MQRIIIAGKSLPGDSQKTVETKKQIRSLYNKVINAICVNNLNQEDNILEIKKLIQIISKLSTVTTEEKIKPHEAINNDMGYVLTAAVDVYCSYKEKEGDNSVALKGLLEIIDELHQAKANPDIVDNNACLRCPYEWGVTALMIAAYKGKDDLDLVKKLIFMFKANTDVQTFKKAENVLSGKSALTYAIQARHKAIACFLITDAKANFQTKDSHGMSPFHYAAEEGMHEVVKLCVASGANVDELGHNGKTGLMLAAENGHVAIAQDLIAANAKTHIQAVGKKNIRGMTALILAAKNGHTDVVRLLLANKTVDVTLQAAGGMTALMCSARLGHHDVVNELLFHKRVNISVLNARRMTALEEAILNPDLEDFQKLPLVSLFLQNKAIIFYPKSVFDFLLTCDQSNPDVLICLAELCRQHDDYNPEYRLHYEKLKILNEGRRQIIFSELNTTTSIAADTINLILEYEGNPLERLGFFASYELDDKLKESNLSHVFRRVSG